MSTLRHVSTTAALGLGLYLLPSLALAAPPDPDVPEGTAGQADASSGSTEIASGGTFSSATDVGTDDEPAEGEEVGPEDPHANDATEFDIAAGGQFNTGNSTTLAATGLANFRLRRTIHQFGAQVAGNYGAAHNDDDEYEANTGNIQGLARYDVFFAKRWTAFLQTTARHDTFQGLNLRLNVDPGFAIYVLNKSKHRMWFEAGYDFQYDLRTDASIARRNEDGLTIDENDLVFEDQNSGIRDPNIDAFFINHAARLFAGYSNKLSDKVSFDTGLEYLQSVIEADRLRLNYLAALNTNLVDRLSVSVTFTLRFDNKPVSNDIAKLDTVTAIALSYSFF